MHTIKNIKIHGFRRLHNVELEMRPLMVLIGANGVGKTSFLDALALFSSSADGKLRETISDMSGIAEIRTRGIRENLFFEATMEIPNHSPLKYKISLEPKGQDYSIEEETLSQEKEGYDQPFLYISSQKNKVKYFDPEKKKLLPPDWDYDLHESALSQVSKTYREPETLRKTLKTISRYHALDVGRQAPIKLPQQMRPILHPGENGENLVAFLYYLREAYQERYEIIEDTIKAVFPGFEAFAFPPVAAGMLSMTWKEKYFKEPTSVHQLSEGTLRFLWLTALLQTPELLPIIMIDEPEVSLHPELLGLLVDLLREASQKTQIIVATHSDRLIRFLEPSEVLVMDINEEGFSDARWADSLNLDVWMQDFTLDELWQMGRMGGRI